ncbi:hypothetical protein N8071_00075 [bacterium]|nr:hypothetical protein [bacterium]
MRKTLLSIAILTVPYLVLSSPALAGCAEDLQDLDAAMTSADFPGEAFDQAVTLRNDAKALCEIGDEAGAANNIADARAILGLPS